MATDDQLAVLLAQNAELFATYEEWANGQIMLLAGTVDDPNSFNEAGGKTGALGYYPVINVSGQTIYVPCLARLRALALGGENAEGFEELVAQVGGKLAAVDAAVAQSGTATALATTKASLADEKATLAAQKAAAAQTVVDAGANILAARDQTLPARDQAVTAAANAAGAVQTGFAASNGANRWRDSMLRGLYDAVPIPPAAGVPLMLDGLRRVVAQGTAAAWDVAASPFGNPALRQPSGSAAAYVSSLLHASEAPELAGRSTTATVGFIADAGVTVSLTVIITDAASAIILQVPTVTIPANGSYQEISAPYAVPAGWVMAEARLGRTGGTNGAITLVGLAAFRGPQARAVTEDRATRYMLDKIAALAASTSATAVSTAQAVSSGLVPGKNKFDASAPFLASSQFSSTGAIQTGPSFTGSFVYTTYFAAVAGQSYVTNVAGGTTIVWYDAAKAVIGAASYTIASNLPRVSPAGTAFFRIALQAASVPPATYQVEMGAAPTAYESYRWVPAYLTIAGENLPEKVVTPIKTTFFVPAKNKFNANGTSLANSQFSATGAVQTNAAFAGSFVYTDYAPALPSTSYVSNNAVNSTIVWYDSAYAVIGGASYAINSGLPRTSPANAAYFRIASQLSPATFQVEIGTVPTSYAAYSLVIDPAVIQQAAAADSPVTPEKTSFMVPGKNRFNPNATALVSSQFGGNGALQTNAAFTGSVVYPDYVPISPSTTIVSNSAVNCTVVWYDAAKAIIGAASYGLNSSLPRTSPANAVYFRVALSLANNPPAALQIEIGAVPTYFEPYALSPSTGPNRAQVNAALGWAANDLTLPRKSYLLKGVENNFYHRCLQRRSVQDMFFTRIVGAVGGATVVSRGRYSRLTPAAVGSATLTATLYDADFDAIVAKTTIVTVTDATTPAVPTTMLAIGDSYLDIGVILRTLVQTVSGLTLVGTRKITRIQGLAYNGQDLRFEGRSGADMAYMCTSIKSPSYPSTGFSAMIHPPGYTFIGNTNTWRDAMSANPGTFAQNLATTGQATRGGYSAGTGYPAAPQVNDLIWDDTAAVFKAWDGSAWGTVTVDVASFVIDIAKYLALYAITAPKIVYLAMGVNDFSGKTPRDVAGSTGPVVQSRDSFARWHTAEATGYMDRMIAAWQAYDPAIRIGILVPPILSQDANDLLGGFMAQKNAAMWEARKQILATWDTPAMEAAGVTVVDAGVAIDTLYGFTRTAEQPFAQYSEGLTEAMTTDTTHPSGGASGGGFAQMGLRAAAWVQAVRPTA